MNQNFVPVVDDKDTFIGIIKRRDIIEYCYDKIKAQLYNQAFIIKHDT